MTNISWKPNSYGPTDSVARSFTQPTVRGGDLKTAPAASSKNDSDYTDFKNEIPDPATIAKFRAKTAMAEERWADAEFQLSEELRLKREISQAGAPVSLSSVQENLDKVRSQQQQRS